MKSNYQKQKRGILGLGLDNKDGHTRLTKGENFVVAGGSEETHEHMTETLTKFNEKLSKRGKYLDNLSREEFIDLMNEASDHS